jgi:Ca2+-binding RTX toxin-like protein
VAALTGGGFVVTWESAPVSGATGQDGSGIGIYARRFNADGSPASGEFKVNTITNGDQKRPRIAALSNGGFVIVWRNESPTSFLAQRYSANGSAVGGELTIKSGSAQSYDVAGLTGGGFVAIWSDGAGGAGMEVYGRQFDSNGSPLAGEFPVNTFSAGGQISSAVSELADGGYVMLWHSDGQDGGGLGVYGRKYLASGAADGGEFSVNVRTADTQAFAAAAALGNGFVVTWTSDKQDGSFYGIFGRLFGETGGGGVINGTPGPDNLIGTTGNDTINGKGGADVMTGLAGNDIYIVNTAGDEVVEAAGEGTDTVKSAVSYTLPVHVENLVLTGAGSINGTGNGLDNTLTGNDASNVLNGKAGADKMSGRGSDDFYYVNNAGDKVAEAADAGTDTVRSSVTYTLPKNVENLLLIGTAAINGTGNSLANRITGNGANNVLNGGPGNDTLIGAAGADRFLFKNALNATTNVDRMTDFDVVDDKIRLENAVFTALPNTGGLAANAFRAAGTASQATHRILYNPNNGALLYDADGTGPTVPVRFATLPAGLALTNASFIVQ